MRQSPIRVEEAKIEGLWFIVKVTYPGNYTRWALRKYRDHDSHLFDPFGKTHKTLNQALDQYQLLKEKTNESQQPLEPSREDGEELPSTAFHRREAA